MEKIMSLWRDCSVHTCSCYQLQRHPLWKLIGFGFIGVSTLTITIGLIVHFTTRDNDSPLQKAEKLLATIILFDGYNEVATNVREFSQNDLTRFNFSANLSETSDSKWSRSPFSQTDLARLKAGFVKAQFFVARADCESQFRDATEITLEQIDVIKRLISNYSDHMELVTSAKEVRESIENGKLASLIGVSGGQSINWSLGILRLYYELGVRYMSLTNSKCSNPWADAAIVDSTVQSRPNPVNEGLSPFGEEVVAEMNRLGMIIDLSHSSIATMKAVLIASKAPVIFSNSNAKALCLNHHNVPDEILKLVKQTDGIVMINFFPGLLNCNPDHKANLSDVVAQLDYLKNKMSANNIGIGSDFDGNDKVPDGLEDVSKFPNLFAALYETGTWSDHDMEKLAGKNMLKLMDEVERVRDKLADEIPRQSWLLRSDLRKMNHSAAMICTTTKLPDPFPMITQYGHEHGRYP